MSDEKQPDKEAIKKLLALHEKQGADIEAAETAVYKLKVKQSDTVKQIAEALAGAPLKIQGKEVSISKRGETWFLRTRREKTGGVEL